ncbi:HAMP domain-containing methyl-accepting chemotaxis protein [Mesobacillus sp. AQ2]|jgi:methyl-accepting chemotaxis protein|uniref:methyl-accepting chemotaxis protein n=1 Tax=Bacillaceae TaxID=186817 RepID=UPI00119CC3F9|nr:MULTISPECIES: HAMP domain-containing methyl-accepting chemotaxis protein [Bacillaceae]MCM3122312.1 methyl-accepting chemotaxis protein [Mesobacillus sp. MER 33]MCM3232276.1 methyl-accepting chemotaxis protein [Mesobacillus sp. MER 48]WHX39221.1 HAMP domain-containing methyl-accepting chemotaxis protein [Mesobacillus sp. AQ2]
MQHWSIGRKYASVFAFIMVIFLGSFIYLSSVLSNLQDAIDLAEEKSDYAIMISEMGATFRQKYIIITDYITEPKPELLTLYKKEAEQFDASAEKLKANVKTENAQTLFEAIVKTDKHMDKIWSDEILKTVDEFRQNGEQVDIFTQISLANKAETIRDMNIEKLNQLQTAILDDRTTIMNETHSSIASMIRNTFILIIIAFIISSVAMYFVSRSISKNLKDVVAYCKKLAAGELNVKALQAKNKDEVGQIIQAMNQLSGNLKASISSILLSSDQVNEMSRNLKENAEATTEANNEITTSIMQVASASDEQVKISERTNEAVENVSSQLIEVTGSMQETLQTTSDTKQKIEQGKLYAINVTEQMDEINGKVTELAKVIHSLKNNSQEIHRIIEIITDISNQTNLLALNAAIEAARAGEHGKGFGVVAQEVRKLAEQSAGAADSIRTILEQTGKETNLAVNVMDESQVTVQKGNELVEKVAATFTEIAQSIEEVSLKGDTVSSAVTSANEKIEFMAQSATEVITASSKSAQFLEQVAATTEEQNATMQELLESSSKLSSMAENLRKSFSSFKL